MYSSMFRRIAVAIVATMVLVPMSGAKSPEQLQIQAIDAIKHDIRALQKTMDSWWRYVCGPSRRDCQQKMSALKKALYQANRDLDHIQQVEATEKARKLARPASKPNHFLVPGTNIYLPQGEGYVYVLECYSSGYNKRVARSPAELFEQLRYQACEQGKGRLVITTEYRGKVKGKQQAWDFATRRRSYRLGN